MPRSSVRPKLSSSSRMISATFAGSLRSSGNELAHGDSPPWAQAGEEAGLGPEHLAPVPHGAAEDPAQHVPAPTLLGTAPSVIAKVKHRM
jgi:hypothetical protein